MVLTTPSSRKRGSFASRAGETYSLFTNTLSNLARRRSPVSSIATGLSPRGALVLPSAWRAELHVSRPTGARHHLTFEDPPAFAWRGAPATHDCQESAANNPGNVFLVRCRT